MDYLENLRNQIKQREKTIQPDRPKLTYRQKQTNFLKNIDRAYTDLGKTKTNRYLNYVTLMADAEDNGIDIDSLAPNYTKIRNLMENEKQARADIGDREFEKTFSKYWNIVQKTKDVDKITKAVKLKKTSYGQDVLDYLPTSLDYTDDEEDQIRKIAKVEPKAFNAKAIHQAANKLREEERKDNEARGIYAEQTAVNPYDEIFSDNAITKDQLIEDLKLINRKSGKLSPKEREIYQQQNQDFNKMVTGAPEYMQQTRQNEDFNKMVTGAASQNQYTPMDRVQNGLEPTEELQYQKDLMQENERAARRKQFAAEIQSKTGRSIEDTVEQFQNITGEFDRTGMFNGTVDYNRLSDEQKQTYEQIKNADPELFIYSQEEREKVYKDPGSAFWAGLRNGFMMGLDELGVREGEISPEEIKRLTLQGFPIGAIVSKKDGKYYVDSVAMENARMAAENPAAFIAGNIGGSIPSTVATGALGKGVAVAAGAGKLGARMAAGALPGAIRGFANSMAQGQDAGGVILNTVGGGLLGAGGQAASAGLENVVGGALQNATPIIQNAAANAAGSVAYSAVDILGRAGITAATGGQVNWTQELSQIPADIILDVVLGGKVDLPSKQKMDIVSKNIVDGKLDLDAVRAQTYEPETKQSPSGVTEYNVKSVPMEIPATDINVATTKTQIPPKTPTSGIPPVPSFVNQKGEVGSTPKTPAMRTSKVAQSTYKATGDEILKKNLDMGLHDFMPKNDTKQYQAALQKVDEIGIKSVLDKYADPVETFTKKNETKTESRRYNDDDVAEMTAALTKAYETGDKAAQQELLAVAVDMGLSGGRMTNMWKMLKKLDGTGYTLYMNRTLKKLNAEGRSVYKGKWNDVSLTDAEVETLRNGKGEKDFKAAEKQIYKRIGQELPSTWTEKDAAWRRTAMLLNPTTHIRNIAGNAIMSGAIEVRDKIIAVIEKTRPKEKRTKSITVKKETMQKARDYYKEANVAEEMSGMKYEVGRLQSLKGEKRVFKNKALNALDTATKTTLKWEDDLFKRGRYEKSLARFMDARGLKEVTPEAHEYAVQDALEATFQDRSAMAEWIQSGKQKKGGAVLDVVVPFVKTPVNVTRRAIEYSPFGLGKSAYDFVEAHKASAEIKKIDKKLNKEGLSEVETKDLKSQRAQYENDVDAKFQKGIKDLAQGMTGTGIFSLGILLASGQLIPGVSITGLAPSSDKEEEFLRDTGWQPLALKVGDTYISIDWATPIAPILIAGAQTYHEITKGQSGDAIEIPLTAVSAIADTITNSSMFTSLKRTLTGKDTIGETVVDTLSNYLGQHIPSFGGKLNAMTEPSEVSYYSKNPLENVKNKAIMSVPGLRQGLEKAGAGDTLNLPKPSTDSWGKEKSTGDTWWRIVDNIFNPSKESKDAKDPVSEEVKRLYTSVGNTEVFPRTFKFKEVTAEVGKQKYTVPISERELADMKKAVGQQAYERVSRYLKSQQYRSSGDIERSNDINKIYAAIMESEKEAFVKNKISKIPPVPKIK